MRYNVVKIGREYWVQSPDKHERSIYSVVRTEDGWTIQRQTWDPTEDEPKVETERVGDKMYKSRQGAAIALGRLLKPFTSSGRYR